MAVARLQSSGMPKSCSDDQAALFREALPAHILGRSDKRRSKQSLLILFLAWSPRPVGSPFCGRKTQQKTKRLYKLVSWNVRTMIDNPERPQRKTALIDREPERYGIHIAALQEMRFSGTGSLREKNYTYIYFWFGRDVGQRREAGVAFAVANQLLPEKTTHPFCISDRMISLRLQLSAADKSRPSPEGIKCSEKERERDEAVAQQPNYEQLRKRHRPEGIKCSENKIKRDEAVSLQPDHEQVETSSSADTEMMSARDKGKEERHQIFTKQRAEYLFSKEFRLKYGYQEINNKTLSTIFISANNLNTSFYEIVTFLELLVHPWDIIGISETFLNSKSPPLHICGYKFIGVHRQNKPDGGGVGLYVHKSITFKRRDDLNLQVDDTKTPCDALFIEISLKDGTKGIVGVVYKPSSVHRKKFQKAFEKVLETIDQEKKLSLIMGDFNINLLDKGQTEFMDAVYNRKHCALIDKPTRICIHKNTETLIDNIYSNAPFKNLNTTSGVLKSDVSDHFPVFQITSFDKKIKDREDKRVLVRKMNFKAEKRFKNRMKSCDWNVCKMDNPNDSYDKFLSIFKTLYDECFPLTEETWITDEIIELQKEKEKTYFDFLKKKTTKDKYTESRAALEELITRNKTDVLGQANTPRKPCECFEADPHEMANILNNRYQPPGKFSSRKIREKQSLSTSTVCMHFNDITPDEIEETAYTHKIFNDNAPLDSEGISHQVVKKVLNSISEVLSYIFNQSFKHGIFPDTMKTVKCDVHFEQGQLTENWTQSCFGKLFEMIACNRTKKFLEENKLLHPRHYLWETDTSKTVSYLRNEIQGGWNDKVGVFLKLEESFRGINQDILLHKLKKYGICGAVHQWFTSNLDGRYQCTQYKSSLSDYKEVSTGIPYTPIGFLLYAIFMNDIAVCPVILHQDEVAIIYHSNKGKKSKRRKEEKENLTKLQKWFKENGLLPHLAMNRCNYISFNIKPQTTQIPVEENEQNNPKNTNRPPLDSAIKKVEKTTFCGATIDSKLIRDELGKSKSASF